MDLFSGTPSTQTDTGPADPWQPRPLRASSPLDLVSFVDHTLGYRPRASCVIITLQGSTLGACLRVDWSAPSSWGAHVEAIADHLAQQARTDRQATASLVLLFGEQVHSGVPGARTHPTGTSAVEAQAQQEHEDLTRALARSLRTVGMPPQESWLVEAGRLWHLDCEEPHRCTMHGVPVSETAVSLVNAAFILEGSVVQDDAPQTELPLPAPEESAELVVARRRWTESDPTPERVMAWLQGWERLLTSAEALTPGSLAEEEAADLVGGLVDLNLRDTLIASAAFTLPRAVSGGEHLGALPEGTAGLCGTRPSEASGLLLLSAAVGDSQRVPSWGRMDRLLEACEVLIPSAWGPTAATLECLAAWVEWCRGRGAAAEQHVRRSRERDPEQQLTLLLQHCLRRGLVAPWASRRESAWSRRP